MYFITINDIEENLNFQSNFDYYTLYDFHKLTENNLKQIFKTFSIFHSNVASITKKHENLEILLQSLYFNFDVISLSKTWHSKDNNDLVSVGVVYL